MQFFDKIILMHTVRFIANSCPDIKKTTVINTEQFCWGIKIFAGYRSENNFIGPSK